MLHQDVVRLLELVRLIEPHYFRDGTRFEPSVHRLKWVALEMKQIVRGEHSEADTCECCGRKDLLVKHHWIQPPLNGKGRVHVRNVCYSCNAMLIPQNFWDRRSPYFNDSHVLPRWEKQKEASLKWQTND